MLEANTVAVVTELRRHAAERGADHAAMALPAVCRVRTVIQIVRAAISRKLALPQTEGRMDRLQLIRFAFSYGDIATFIQSFTSQSILS